MISLTAQVTENGITAPGGDPAELRDVARLLRAAAEAYAEIADTITRAGATAGASWSGPASFFFERRVAMTTDAIDTAPVACSHAATALENLADALEAARYRALDAQAAAGMAMQTLVAVSRDRAELASSPAANDPYAQRSLAARETCAETDLAYARRDGEDALADARAAATQAAAAIIAAADSIKVPPVPENADEVPPFESTGAWAWRNGYDAVVDPVLFWNMPGAYRQERSVFDTVTAGGGALVGYAKTHRHALFLNEAYMTRPGLLVPETRISFNPSTLTLEPQRTWVQGPPIATKLVGTDIATTAKVAKVAKVAGPVGTVVSYGTAGLDQWYEDRNRTDLSGAEKTGRVVGSSAIVGTASLVGGIAGAKAGALVGAAIGSWIPIPGVGTLTGGMVGAVVGGIIGSGTGQVIGSKLKDWVFG